MEIFRKVLSEFFSANVWRELLFRGGLLGLVLWLVLTDDRFRNLGLNVVALLVGLIWSYSRGLLGHRRWSGVWLEGLAIYLIAVAFSNLLRLFLDV